MPTMPDLPAQPDRINRAIALALASDRVNATVRALRAMNAPLDLTSHTARVGDPLTEASVAASRAFCNDSRFHGVYDPLDTVPTIKLRG